MEKKLKIIPSPNKVDNGIYRAWKFAEDRVGLPTVVALLALFITPLIWYQWDWLHGGEDGITTVRNLGLIFAAIIAIIGLPLAIWRSFVADRQSKTAQRGRLNERYQKSAAMLGSKVLSVRLGGIYALKRLAQEHAEDYHIQIVKLFCAFVRKPPGDDDTPQEEHSKIREDVQAIMTTLGRRNEEQQKIEKRKISKEPILNLVGANLSGAVLTGANLSGAVLHGANLSSARLEGADLSNAVLDDADLSRAELNGAKLFGTVLHGANLSVAGLYRVDLSGAGLYEANLSSAGLYEANLSGAKLKGADLSRAVLEGVSGLTQDQLDKAGVLIQAIQARLPNGGLVQVPQPKEFNPPKLEGAKDSETGEPLVWHG